MCITITSYSIGNGSDIHRTEIVNSNVIFDPEKKHINDHIISNNVDNSEKVFGGHQQLPFFLRKEYVDENISHNKHEATVFNNNFFKDITKKSSFDHKKSSFDHIKILLACSTSNQIPDSFYEEIKSYNCVKLNDLYNQLDKWDKKIKPKDKGSYMHGYKKTYQKAKNIVKFHSNIVKFHSMKDELSSLHTRLISL